MREVRKWEDLNFDCLLNILRRVGTLSLLLDVPFVCKSWHRASLDHSCWQHIDISIIEFTGILIIYKDSFSEHKHRIRFKNEFRVKNLSIGGLIKLSIARSLGKSTSVLLPSSCRDMDLYHISETYHELTSLSFWLDCIKDRSVIPKLIGKWKLLEELTLSMNKAPILQEVVSQIGQNCSKFHSLTICHGMFEEKDALAIANYLPKITKLSLRQCRIEQKNLEIVILVCKDLEFLDVNDCLYCLDLDEKKLKDLAVHINTFNFDVYTISDINISDYKIDFSDVDF